MLIVVALNLPFTAVFDSENDDEAQSLDLHKTSHQSAQSLIRSEPQESDTPNELPFDFDTVKDESRPVTPIPSSNTTKPKSLKPSRSIVDERKPVSSIDLRERSKASPSINSGAQSTKGSGSGIPQDWSWNPSRAAEIVDNQLRTKTYFGSLTRMYGEDDDVKLERGKYESSSRLHGVQNSSALSLSSLSSRSIGRRRDSVVSHVSLDASGAEHLNLKFHLDISRSANRGLFNALENALSECQIENYKCVGTIGMDTDSLPQSIKDNIEEALKNEHDCRAVFISDSEREGHYDQYCKEILWPTIHCQIPDIPTSKAYEEHSWGYYVKVNQAIADKVVETYEVGDTIWVHDYHLMLVPLLVRERLPHASIGFFMHVPFPSSEVFRCLAYRAELLSGVLAANSVAFHIPEYAQHFKMSLARLLAVDITGPGIIETSDHDAFVTTCPLGIDMKLMDRMLDIDNPLSAVQQHRRVIRQRWPHQRLIAGRDKLDPVRGLPQKLKAFEQFLAENPHWASKVVLVQICNPGPYVFQNNKIDSIVDQINSTYGDIASGVQPVVLLKQDVRFEQYLALISEADGFCVSCLRDGMNLTCHEYAYCNDSSRMGPLILSEFTGSASVLGEHSLLINPWNQNQLAQAFKHCVEMPRWERQRRWEGLRTSIVSRSASLWASTLINHINLAWEDEMSRECSKPDINVLENIYHSVSESESRMFLLEVEPASTHKARLKLLKEKGEKVKQRHGHLSSNPELLTRGPYYTNWLHVVLRDLCSDRRNLVYVASAESPDHLERMYRSLPGLGLVAEFGKFVRLRDAEDWIELPCDQKSEWREQMKPWLRMLRDRSLAEQITFNESSIIVEFKVNIDNGGQRDLSKVGEYVSLINDHYARELGIRTKVEGHVLTLYQSNLGDIRKQAYQMILDHHKNVQLGMLMVANQPFAIEANDTLYQWAESMKDTKRTRDLVTMVVGRHPSHARCMVEGANALLKLLQTIRTKEPAYKARDTSRRSIEAQ